MSDTLVAPGAGEVEDLTAGDLLALARDRKAVEERAAADLLQIAARWADLHPPESIHGAAAFTVPGCEQEEPIAGEGAPLVAEFCVAGLGTTLGITTTAAKKLIGHALELRHRLPRLWAQVHAGQVPAWRARAVADTTIHSTPALTVEAAGFVDAQVAAVAGRVGSAQLDRLVDETIRRYDLAVADPTTDPEDGYLHVDPRHVTVDTDDVHYAGTLRIEAEVDIADALDLDRALAHHAKTQKALGSLLPLDARRAKALGELARTQTALDLLTGGPGQDRVSSDAVEPHLPAARQVVIHAHLDASFSGDATVFGPAGRMENGQRLVLLEQIQSWCADTRTEVTIKPVIDLNTQLTAQAYKVPAPIREQVQLRDRTCVFPGCARPARPDTDRQPRLPVPVPPPTQDSLRLAIHDDRARGVRVDQPPRAPLPPRPHRHHRPRATNSTRHPPTTPTMTPPHTPPPTRLRGQKPARGAWPARQSRT